MSKRVDLPMKIIYNFSLHLSSSGSLSFFLGGRPLFPGFFPSGSYVGSPVSTSIFTFCLRRPTYFPLPIII